MQSVASDTCLLTTLQAPDGRRACGTYGMFWAVVWRGLAVFFSLGSELKNVKAVSLMCVERWPVSHVVADVLSEQYVK